MASLPKWSVFWAAYPDYVNFTSPQVKVDIGGAVNADWITNTCAIRMSRALNYVGIPVPGNFSGLHTVKGADSKRYAYRVRELRPWLKHELGTPALEFKKKQNEAFDRSQLAGIHGLIAFDIQFKDATGHLDALYGQTFSSEEHGLTDDYFALATKISVWKCS